MRWTEAAFWACPWVSFVDAWTGYRRFTLGLDPDDEPLGRHEATKLDRAVAEWQRTGEWKENRHG